MSQLKKALQQLAENQEFYAMGFLSHSLYQEWQRNSKVYFADEFTALIQTDVYHEERLTWLLKKQPDLVKRILHRDVLSHIKPWYQQHPSADIKRQRRQHTALVDTLYILCARYKKQLRYHIFKASNGFIGLSLEENVLAAENPIPLNHTSLPLTTAQQQQLTRALKHYQTTVKLEKTLMGEASAQQKLYQFMQRFYAPTTQAALHQHPPAGVIKLFKKLGIIFQFEQWLATKRSTADQPFSLNHHLLTELSQEVKKIVF